MGLHGCMRGSNAIAFRIGGGDQVYQDGIRVDGPLREWTDIPNPTTRAKYPFPESLRKACETWYLETYIRW